MPTVLKPDPFSAVLLESPALLVTQEQRRLIKEILEISSSDSRFSEKAYLAIERVLTGGITVAPVVTGLNPGSATVGDANFTLHVQGTGFYPDSVIVFNGGEEPTTHVSNTELTTGVDMSTVSGAVTVPVSVLNSSGIVSDPLNFVFQAASPALSVKSKPVVELGHELKEQKKEVEESHRGHETKSVAHDRVVEKEEGRIVDEKKEKK